MHLRVAHKSLRRTGALTIEETLNREEVMNMVSEGVIQAFQDIQPSSLDDNQSNTSTTTNTNSTPTIEQLPFETYDRQSQSMNATTVLVLTVQTLQQQMDMLQAMMNQMQCMLSNSTNNNGNFRRGGRNQ